MIPKLVVDSSVAVKWFLTEPHSGEALQLLERLRAGTLELLAPELIHAEIGNILWKRLRKQEISPLLAAEIVREFRELPIAFTRDADLLDSALELAVRHDRTAYDSLYLALCEQANCPFVTADERLVNAVRPAISAVYWIGDMPPIEPAESPAS